MPGPSAKILLVDDDAAILAGVAGLLEDEGYRTVRAPDTAAARAILAEPRDAPSALVLDIQMPGETGLDFLESLSRPLPLPVVILSGEASIDDTVRALKLGATDFVEKPPSAERLLTAIRNALALEALSEEREHLRRELARPGHLVGDSEVMDDLRQTVARVGPTPSLILIRGETGTGKERVARALHLASGRSGRFVAVNCAAIPGQLLESELFGYERGAFSGAASRRIGRVEQADGGTLLLDEIGDMPMELQAKLLRVLEDKEVERLGGNGPVRVDVRFLAATHQDLELAVAEGRLREDLFYRLNVFPLHLPPLRDRAGDIEPLLRAFASDFLGPTIPVEISPDGARALESYGWPGNVRELRNFVERLCLLRRGDALVVDGVAASGLRPMPTASASALAMAPKGDSDSDSDSDIDIDIDIGDCSYRELVEGFERRVLEAALSRSSGNVAEAARLLKTDRGNLYRRIKALGVSTS